MKVIFLITFSPKYDEYANKSRPEWNWDTDNGSWVGIWGSDWGDLIGKALANYSEDVEYEVWQVDVRADKIYTAELDRRLVHKNFPSKEIKYFRGLKISVYTYSKEIIECTKHNNKRNVTYFIPSTVNDPFIKELLSSIDKATIIYYNFLNNKLLLPDIEKSYNPLRLVHRYLLRKRKLNELRNIKYLLTYNDNSEALNILKANFPHIHINYFGLGLDCEYWKQDKTVEEARRYLNIPFDRYIIFLSQRLVPEYQIDKFIQTISKVTVVNNYRCYISGHGTKMYERYLTELVKEYNLEDMIHFVGYVSNEDLKNYFIACDIFATVPIMFAGSDGVKKAMAINKPVVHVTLGGTYEFLRENNAGIFLNPTDYNQWRRVFEEIIDGKEINTVPREKVVREFSWEKTAKEFLYAIEYAGKK
jgi:glycosyltransferase involved in cell wall biosynthesis